MLCILTVFAKANVLFIQKRDVKKISRSITVYYEDDIEEAQAS
jgi:hypothetical protein